MPDRTPCKYCGKVGFVRCEHVLKGAWAIDAFYCGACDRSWEVRAQQAHAQDTARRSGNDDSSGA